MNFNISVYEIIMIVHELHQRGYEQLRLLPGMSPNGCAWRWRIYPKALMGEDNRFERGGDCTPFDSIISENNMLGSTGEAYPEEKRDFVTADQFIESHERFIEMAKGDDAEYVNWFAKIVEHAKNNDFPIGFADGPIGRKWLFTSSKEELEFPPFAVNCN